MAPALPLPLKKMFFSMDYTDVDKNAFLQNMVLKSLLDCYNSNEKLVLISMPQFISNRVVVSMGAIATTVFEDNYIDKCEILVTALTSLKNKVKCTIVHNYAASLTYRAIKYHFQV